MRVCFSSLGRSWGDCGAYLLWGVFLGRVRCLHLGFRVPAVDGADDGRSGEAVIKSELVSRRGWRLVDSSGQYNSRWRQSVGERKS